MYWSYSVIHFVIVVWIVHNWSDTSYILVVRLGRQFRFHSVRPDQNVPECNFVTRYRILSKSLHISFRFDTIVFSMPAFHHYKYSFPSVVIVVCLQIVVVVVGVDAVVVRVVDWVVVQSY